MSRFFPRTRNYPSPARALILGLLTCFLVLLLTTQSQAQFNSSGDTSNLTTLRPPGVDRYGSLEVTWVNSPLRKEKLFQIASPMVADRNDLTQLQVAVETRARSIENLIWVETQKYRELALSQLLNSEINTDSLPSAQVIASTLRNLPVIQVVLDTNSRPITVATVTSADVDFYGQSSEQVAEQWRESLQAEVSETKALFSPSSLHQRIQETITIIVVLIVMTLLFSFIRWRLGRRYRILKERYATEAAEAAIAKTDADQLQMNLPTTEPSQIDSFQINEDQTNGDATNQLKDVEIGQQSEAEAAYAQTQSLVKKQLSQARWLDIYNSIRWALLWVIILSWYAGIYLVTTRLPNLMRWSERVLTQPLKLIVIWFVVSMAIRVSSLLIQRSFRSWMRVSYLTFGDTQRKVVRAQTISNALRGLATSAFVLFGILATLIEFGLSPASIFAGSAIIGFAFSFGSQSLVKDLVNGCLILLEDQFAVGDIVSANGEAGIVERLNLRLTQLRSLDGELISMPNSTITLVKNKSNGWARVNLGIDVAYNTNLDYAIETIKESAIQMSQDSDWQSLILEPPEVLGVDSFNESSITIRLLVRTVPAQQWFVARELRRRLKQAFDQSGISMPFPQRSIWFKNAPPVVGIPFENQSTESESIISQ